MMERSINSDLILSVIFPFHCPSSHRLCRLHPIGFLAFPVLMKCLQHESLTVFLSTDDARPAEYLQHFLFYSNIHLSERLTQQLKQSIKLQKCAVFRLVSLLILVVYT